MAKTEQSSIKQVKQRSVSWSMIQDLWAPALLMLVNLAALGFGGWRLHRDGLTHTNLALIIGAPAHPPTAMVLCLFGTTLRLLDYSWTPRVAALAWRWQNDHPNAAFWHSIR